MFVGTDNNEPSSEPQTHKVAVGVEAGVNSYQFLPSVIYMHSNDAIEFKWNTSGHEVVIVTGETSCRMATPECKVSHFFL